MKKLEQKFTRIFQRELSLGKIQLPPACVIEFKKVTGNTYNRNQLKYHQVEALQSAEKEGIFYKIADTPASRFMMKKPFDAFYIQSPSVFVGIFWYKMRIHLHCNLIPWKNYLALLLEKGKLTEEVVSKYSTYTLNLPMT